MLGQSPGYRRPCQPERMTPPKINTAPMQETTVMRSPRKADANTTVTTGIRYSATVQRTVPSASQAMFQVTKHAADASSPRKPRLSRLSHDANRAPFAAGSSDTANDPCSTVRPASVIPKRTTGTVTASAQKMDSHFVCAVRALLKGI